MNVICLEEPALMALVEQVYERLKDQKKVTHEKWIDGAEVMQMLGVKSKTTLQKMRNEGVIRFTQPQHKVILYDRDSVMEYLDNHAKNTF